MCRFFFVNVKEANLSVTILTVDVNRGRRVLGMFQKLLRRYDGDRLLPLRQQVLVLEARRVDEPHMVPNLVPVKQISEAEHFSFCEEQKKYFKIWTSPNVRLCITEMLSVCITPFL